MATNYGYYLPLGEVFQSVRFLDISPKIDLDTGEQKVSKDGFPHWVVSALVRVGDGKPETESFALLAPEKQAHVINEIAELAPVRLIGLAGGKYARTGNDRTTWTFQVSAVVPAA